MRSPGWHEGLLWRKSRVIGQEGDTGGDDLSQQCWKVQALPVCLARWATVIYICEEAEHQPAGQGERFTWPDGVSVGDSPGHIACLHLCGLENP